MVKAPISVDVQIQPTEELVEKVRDFINRIEDVTRKIKPDYDLPADMKGNWAVVNK